MDAVGRRLLPTVEHIGVHAAMKSIRTVRPVAVSIMIRRSVLRGIQRGQFNRPGVVAALLRAHGARHVAVLEEALVEADETHLTVGDATIVALIAAGLGLESGSVALQSILEHAQTTALDARLLLDAGAAELRAVLAVGAITARFGLAAAADAAPLRPVHAQRGLNRD